MTTSSEEGFSGRRKAIEAKQNQWLDAEERALASGYEADTERAAIEQFKQYMELISEVRPAE